MVKSLSDNDFRDGTAASAVPDVHVSTAVDILKSADIERVEALFYAWRDTSPNLEELVDACCNSVGFSDASKQIVMVGAAMAAEENKNPYHNNDHFREVFALTFMLANHGHVNGRISEKHFARRLTAALLHDYKHDGKTNTVDGQHVPFRLEQQSFDAAKDRLIEAGATRKDMTIIEALILGTDVSAPQGEVSPAASMKNYSESGNPDDLHPRLRVLHGLNLVDTSLLLHDTDVGLSAAISREFNERQGEDLRIEWGLDEPPDQKFFLNALCRGRMFSRSGRALLQNSMNDVLKSYGIEPAA